MFSVDGVMPPDGPPNVLKTLALVDDKIAATQMDLNETYDTTFARSVPATVGPMPIK